MAWTGDVARVHCDVISAETYLENAIGALERMEKDAPAREALESLPLALWLIRHVLPCLERDVSPEVLELLHGQVIPMEKVEKGEE